MATQNRPLSILCIASFFKGEEFMRAAKDEGCTVYLITSISLKQANWPHAHIDEIFYVEELGIEFGSFVSWKLA